MKLTKQLEAEIKRVMEDYWNSYFTGDLDHWATYLVDDYRNIGGTEEEIWNSRQEILDYTHRVIDQMKGVSEIRNKQVQIIPYDPYIMVHELLDIYIKIEDDWKFYQKFRLSSLIQKQPEGWKVLHQHGSYPDSKTDEGEAFAFDTLKNENLRLQEAIKVRTLELETQNRELEIEASLERVRTVAMSMYKPDDLLNICNALFNELQLLQFNGLRNVIIHTYLDVQNYFIDYDFSDFTKGHISQIPYRGNPILEKFVQDIRKSRDAFTEIIIAGKELKEWQSFRDANNEAPDARLGKTDSLYYYMYSIGDASIGISTFNPVPADKQDVLKRFRNVFDLAYKRYVDITNAIAQTKEAQIETSLERVRAQAMAMRTPEDLTGICEVLYAALHSLGFAEIRNAMINIHDDEKETFVNYDYSDEIGKSINHLVYNIHPVIEKQVKQMRSAGDAFSETYFKGKDLKDWKEFRKSIGEKDDPRIEKAEALYYYFYSIGTGSIGISTFSVIAEEKLNVLKRFRNVFNLSYQRYTDIALAEAQAREAKIEAALEKVRSRSLAMYKSDELNEVILVVFEKLKEFNVVTDGVALINLYAEGTRDVIQWIANPELMTTGCFTLPYFDHPILNIIWKAREGGKNFLTHTFEFEEKNSFWNYTFQHTDYKYLTNDLKKMLLESEGYGYIVAFEKYSSILVCTYTKKQFSADAIEILKRFAKVFEQAYIRFLDLQKAEAQAREARIESALERVRSKMMAMHQSSELKSVIQEATNQLQQLGFKVHSANFSINMNIHEDPDMHLWVGVPGEQGYFTQLDIPYFDHPMFTKTYQAIDRGEELVTDTFTPEEKKTFYEHVYEHTALKNVSDERKKMVLSAEAMARSTALLKNSALTVINYEGTSYTDEENNILKRIAKVFDQAYTRFLDLQKAEAQAREAQIEAALEKVRSRSLAMHNSDELRDVVKVVFEKLQKLDFGIDGAAFIITQSDDLKSYNSWIGDSHAEYPSCFKIPYYETPSIKDIWNANESGTDFISKTYSFEEKNHWFKYAFENTDLKNLPNELKNWILQQEYLTQSFAWAKKSGVGIHFHHQRTLSENEIDILKRFSNVFEQAYIRFLDLQKAEAQAREAKIEAALEKVRSRSLAMHESDELKNVVTVVLKILEEFNLVFEGGAVIVTFTEGSKDLTYWIASDLLATASRFHFPYFDHPIVNMYAEAKENGKDFFAKVYPYEIKNSYYHYAFEHSDFKYLPDDLKNFIFGTNCIGASFALTNNAAILTPSFSGEIITEKEGELLKRFARAFEQVYIRFLDLQKAEAQARESQIETSLERVRARTMAMQKTSGFVDVINVLGEQFIKLGFDFNWANFSANGNNVSDGIDIWNFFVVPGAYQGASRLFIPLFDHPVFQVAYEKFQEFCSTGKDFYALALDKKEKDKFFDHLFATTAYKDLSDELKRIQYNGEGYVTSSVFLKDTWLSIGNYNGKPFTDEQNSILKRLGNAFGQAHTRFLDLQNAEAQAREAKIEASLERVRSKAMAMHSSQDLTDTIGVFYKEIQLYSITPRRCGVGLLNKGTRIAELSTWNTTDEGSSLEIVGVLKMQGHPVLDGVYENWLLQKEYHPVLRGNEIKEYYQMLKPHISFPDYPHDVAQYGYFFYFTEGGVYAWTEKEMAEDELAIYRRFTSVLSLTYKRYKDLKEAEAQARESQIQLALERVRAKTMAMHSSQDVAETVAALFDELQKLAITTYRCGIGIIHDTTLELWTARPDAHEKPELVIGRLDMSIHPLFQGALKGWKNKQESFFYDLKGDDLIRYYKALNSQQDYSVKYDLSSLPSQVFHYEFYFNEGALFVFSLEQLSAETLAILKRFAGVFGQTYRRFLDLQKAEAQARESQIELGLERVRARAMAMQKSDELKELIGTVFIELTKLDLVLTRCLIMIYDTQTNDSTWWMANSEAPTEPIGLLVKYHQLPPYTAYINAWQERKNKWQYILEATDKKDWDDFLFVETELSHLPDFVIAGMKAPDRVYLSASFNNFGCLNLASLEPLSDEHFDILLRFAKVFDLTYTRFNDLQKAEAQAREAQIELALERVRARTMAMQKSEELQETSLVLFEQLKSLGEPIEQSTIGIFHEAEGIVEISATVHGTKLTKAFRHPIDDPHMMSKIFNGYKSGQRSMVIELKGKELEAYNRYRNEVIVGEDIFPTKLPADDRRVVHVGYFSKGMLALSTNQARPRESMQLLERFASVFGQTYRRFLDLQKAEAQAREAQIEAALERVRYKAMAMQSSEDVGSATAVVFNEMSLLGVETMRCGITIIRPDQTTDVWAATTTNEGKTMKGVGSINLQDHPLWTGMFNAWHNKEDSFSYHLKGADQKAYYKVLVNSPNYAAPYLKEELPEHFFYASFFEEGAVFTFSLLEHNEENKKVLKKFTAVFSLTFRRYQDLQKAEAQTRESQIELSLERVRAKTMAMQKSDELPEAANLLFLQIQSLGMPAWSAGYCIWNEDKTAITAWMSSEGVLQPPFRAPTTEDELFIQMREEHEKGKTFHVVDMGGENLVRHYQYMRTLPVVGEILDSIMEAGHPLPTYQIMHYAYFTHGLLLFITYEPVPEAHEIFKRFGKVFDQTYTRFLDLQKAEAQAREAQIENALEKVRSRTMAMQRSDELAETAAVLFKQMIDLGIKPNRLYIGIINDESGDLEFWITDEDGNKVSQRYIVNVNKNISIKKMYEGWAARKKTITIDMQGKELEAWLTYWNKEFHVPFKKGAGQNRRVQNISYFSKGFIAIASPDDQPEETTQLLDRFAAVFNLTYTRFNDLQMAEAQAREAIIEAALERVRGKAMAMHNSNDLSSAASMVFTELRKLGINPIRCGVGLLSKQSRKAQLYSATSSAGGDSLSLVGWVLLEGHPVLEHIYESWLTSKDYFPQLQGEQLKSYYELLLAGLSVKVPDWQDGQKQYGHFFSFSIGCLYTWSEAPYNEAEIKILKRFASIIDLTFRRYLDLQKAEASAKEAIKQAALDRIRADIASMRTINDLDRITPLIWNELTILGIPFIRCGVFIMDEAQQLINTFLSMPDGKAIAAFHLPYDTPGNISEVLQHWQNKKIYTDHWDEDAFKQFANSLVKQGALTSSKQYLSTLPAGGFYLHFLPFQQGMLYVGNTTQLNEEEIKLLQSVADAFSTAYARYEDFNKLEAAKQQVDRTLVDLKQAQHQLVQSEKMASLGELTAGIAHEIQNPLNFVNNFSEVSNELIEELKIKNEKLKIEDDEVNDLLNDIKQNLEKINHHGKRADAIVKGMLQHSRKSEGKKESTDINALADEYLRLAYHGLRAKDKSFNAKFETDFDSSLPKINIVPQDIGRGILNLITNAFYAVTEKKKQTGGDFEPLVTVSTKKLNDKVEIKVKDNGNGIPQKVVNKIFQPFFTTKPTGEGTGLGLSLSYDIIKAHGGEIKVESREGEGSEFIIQLPV